MVGEEQCIGSCLLGHYKQKQNMRIIDRMSEKVKKVVLAYSGGLDTSVILRWLMEEYDCEVIAFSADIGQEEVLDTVEEKSLKTWASKVYIDNLQE